MSRLLFELIDQLFNYAQNTTNVFVNLLGFENNRERYSNTNPRVVICASAFPDPKEVSYDDLLKYGVPPLRCLISYLA